MAASGCKYSDIRSGGMPYLYGLCAGQYKRSRFLYAESAGVYKRNMAETAYGSSYVRDGTKLDFYFYLYMERKSGTACKDVLTLA